MSWRDRILEEFVPQISKLTLVADPDNLLTEEKLSLELRHRGFDLIEFIDSVEFRFAYESRYRFLWDKGEHTDLVVILRLEDSELHSLPYDLLKSGRLLGFNLGELFPNLSYPVVESLDRSLLDALFSAQITIGSDRLGDNATKDFVLRHVFGIAGELIRDEVELLRMLLRVHYGSLQIPEILGERLVQTLRTNKAFQHWPLDHVVSDANRFFEFLQKCWPAFLKRFISPEQVVETSGAYSQGDGSPAELPFDHQDIRVYIDNLFLEGKLSPIPFADVASHAPSWIQVGIISDTTENDRNRITGLFELVRKECPAEDGRFSDWTTYALKWGELTSLVHGFETDEFKKSMVELSDQINASFGQWLVSHYSSLINLPPYIPAMLHHIPRRLARDVEDTPGKAVALVVMDGMAIDQWVIIRNCLQKQNESFLFRESATFAWIPTMTPVSRQALFGAKAPMYFPSTINTTNNDEKLWKQYWENCGISRLDVAYLRGLRSGDPASSLEAVIHPGKTRVVGLVVDMVDKIAHSSLLGTAGLHTHVEQWLNTGYLNALLSRLLDLQFDVWLTSDHGNTECQGKGRPAEGVIADMRGERVRVYPTDDLRSQVAGKFAFSQAWESIGLPPEYFPLIAGGRNAFVTDGETIVAHGGLSIEEVIVPLVKLERRL